MRNSIYLDDKIGVSEFIPRPIYSEEWKFADRRKFYNHVVTEFQKNNEDNFVETDKGRFALLIPNKPEKKLEVHRHQPGYYPYGQYITRMNLMPEDEQFVNENINGNKNEVISFAYNRYMRNNLLSEANYSQVLQEKIARGFVHKQSQNWVSPYN